MDFQLKNIFSPIADKLSANEECIVTELIAVQGSRVDLGGYYLFDDKKAIQALRPSRTVNSILADL